jgi:putative DNA primase/helicase
MTGYDAVPDALADRDQWLTWDADTDTPKAPLWNGRVVSWNTPEEWHTFAEAVGQAHKKDTRGIGYSFAYGNDDHPAGRYGALDLDGCLTDDDLAEWVPSLDPFIERDAYIEVSPSGDGLHIPLEQFTPPEWWTDLEDDDNHEGLEAYGSKFFTVTADPHPESGTEIPTAGPWVNEWLAAAYENYTGETPPRDETLAEAADSGPRDDASPTGATGRTHHETKTLAVTDARDALAHVDPDCGYSQWRNIGFALADEYDDETALELFTEWSRGDYDPRLTGDATPSKWDSDAPERAERVIRDADPAGESGVTLGTLVHYATRDDELGAWEKPPAAPSPSDPPTDGLTWDDVRAAYAEQKAAGRQAARALLESRYQFMCIDGDDTLRVYDPETGTYTDNLGEIRGEIYDELNQGGHWTRHELQEILAGLRENNVVPQDAVNAGNTDAPLRCVANGVIDLVTREHDDHSPEHYFTERIPVRFDPEADTAPYEEFLDSMVQRAADRKALLEMVGHALIPDANERYKKFLMLTGPADNGKSQFFARIRALLNGPDGEESNTSSVKLSKLAQNRFSHYAMYGAAANIAGEIDGKKIRNTAALKDVTGGDAVELEPKGRDSFFAPVNATLMFAANDPPILGERDKEAIASRIVPIELPYRFCESPDPDDSREKQAIPESDLRDELETPEALSGLFTLALDGIERLEANGGDVSLPESESERLRMYERSADPMREFGEECLTNHPEDYVVKADVTTLYREWAADNGYEVSESVGKILHRALRGTPGLNYTTSHPRAPDYSETSLSLRGWDERKRVVNRLTLTETGREYAEQAGLVESDTDTEESEETALAAREPQYGATITARVATANAGEYTRSQQGRLEGPNGSYIGFVVPGGNTTTLTSYQGDTIRLENVTLRTNDDGLLQAVIDDAVVVDRVSRAGDGATLSANGVTDGGREHE